MKSTNNWTSMASTHQSKDTDCQTELKIQDPPFCFLWETHLTTLLWKEGQKISNEMESGNKKALLMVWIQTESNYKDKEGHFKYFAILNIYALNLDTHNFIKQICLDIKQQIDPNTLIVHDFCISLSPMNRSFRQKNEQKNKELNGIIDEKDLIDI